MNRTTIALGLAATLMLAGADVALPRQELDLLKDTLTRALAEPK